jgi:ribosomal protein S8
LNLIHQWYFEIPSTVNLYQHWTSHGLFVHPHHAKGSPHILKLDEKENENFIALMRTRTPELLSRVKRTKELEAELLKLPDSELSQNMKEFIKLRGYLVDIRFAENETAENNAFDDLVKFVDKSKDKELWIHFVDEVAFDSIFDTEYFPHKKVQNYRKRFAEKFTVKTGVNE